MTETGPENLSAAVPVQIDDIEELCRTASRLA